MATKEKLSSPLYALVYGSKIDDENEVYTEISGVYGTLDDARKALDNDYESIRVEEFDGYDDEQILFSKGDIDFSISSIDGDKYISMKIVKIDAVFK